MGMRRGDAPNSRDGQDGPRRFLWDPAARRIDGAGSLVCALWAAETPADLAARRFSESSPLSRALAAAAQRLARGAARAPVWLRPGGGAGMVLGWARQSDDGLEVALTGAVAALAEALDPPPLRPSAAPAAALTSADAAQIGATFDGPLDGAGVGRALLRRTDGALLWRDGAAGAMLGRLKPGASAAAALGPGAAGAIAALIGAPDGTRRRFSAVGPASPGPSGPWLDVSFTAAGERIAAILVDRSAERRAAVRGRWRSEALTRLIEAAGGALAWAAPDGRLIGDGAQSLEAALARAAETPADDPRLWRAAQQVRAGLGADDALATSVPTARIVLGPRTPHAPAAPRPLVVFPSAPPQALAAARPARGAEPPPPALSPAEIIRRAAAAPLTSIRGFAEFLVANPNRSDAAAALVAAVDELNAALAAAPSDAPARDAPRRPAAGAAREPRGLVDLAALAEAASHDIAGRDAEPPEPIGARNPLRRWPVADADALAEALGVLARLLDASADRRIALRRGADGAAVLELSRLNAPDAAPPEPDRLRLAALLAERAGGRFERDIGVSGRDAFRLRLPAPPETIRRG